MADRLWEAPWSSYEGKENGKGLQGILSWCDITSGKNPACGNHHRLWSFDYMKKTTFTWKSMANKSLIIGGQWNILHVSHRINAPALVERVSLVLLLEAIVRICLFASSFINCTDKNTLLLGRNRWAWELDKMSAKSLGWNTALPLNAYKTLGKLGSFHTPLFPLLSWGLSEVIQVKHFETYLIIIASSSKTVILITSTLVVGT